MEQGLFLFGYGSLVSAESIAGTLGRDLPPRMGPIPAVLDGWQRSWNVGSDRRSHPERRMMQASGEEFGGTMAILGVSPVPGRECPGAVYQVTQADLVRLADRERNYFRQDVTAQTSWPGKPPGCLVVTFVPTAIALDRLREAEENNSAVIRLEYDRLVEAAFDALEAGGLQRFRNTTIQSSLERRALTRTTRIKKS